MEGGPRKVPCQRGKEFVLLLFVVVVVDLYALTRSPLLSAGVGGFFSKRWRAYPNVVRICLVETGLLKVNGFYISLQQICMSDLHFFGERFAAWSGFAHLICIFFHFFAMFFKFKAPPGKVPEP